MLEESRLYGNLPEAYPIDLVNEAENGPAARMVSLDRQVVLKK